MDCFATKLQDNNGAVRSFEEQSDSGGGQFFSTVGTRMFSTSLQVPVLSLATRSKMKDPRPIIVTTLTDNCPSTEDGPTVTQLNPNLLSTYANSTHLYLYEYRRPNKPAAFCHSCFPPAIYYAEQTYSFEYRLPYTPSTFCHICHYMHCSGVPVSVLQAIKSANRTTDHRLGLIGRTATSSLSSRIFRDGILILFSVQEPIADHLL
jgi:hypothetical protein